MRKLFTLVVLVAATLVTIPAQAQFKFGLKGGLNLTDMSFSVDDVDVSNHAGFFIGPTAKFTLPIVGLGLDASVLYDQREAKLKGADDKIKQQAINIPINLRYNIGLGSMAGIYLAAGPQFGFNCDKSLFRDMDISVKDANVTWNVCVGLTLLNHLQVGAGYNFGIGKWAESKDPDVDLSAKANTWQVQVAYLF